jgi:hypothetical protein
MSDSTRIVPPIQPTTAFRAARSSRAEKNFWYMFASPISRSIVGKNRYPTSVSGSSVPKIDTWSGRSAAKAGPIPPA